MDSILITGGSGFLGAHLASTASLFWKTYVLYNSNPISTSYFQCIKTDITNTVEVMRIVEKISPDIIIHSAAATNMAYCENNQEIAWKTNVIGTQNIALAAELIGAKLIYVSTDLVFDGTKKFYTEIDSPNPISFYGRTKFEGEKIVSNLCTNYIIARISLFFGWGLSNSKCFTELIVDTLKEGKNITLFIDEYRTPIYIINTCEILCDLANVKCTKEIFHIAGSQRISRYELGLLLADIFNFNKDLIVPITMDGITQYRNRPKDCSLNNKKILNTINIKLTSIEDSLKDMKYQYNL